MLYQNFCLDSTTVRTTYSIRKLPARVSHPRKISVKLWTLATQSLEMFELQPLHIKTHENRVIPNFYVVAITGRVVYPVKNLLLWRRRPQ